MRLLYIAVVVLSVAGLAGTSQADLIGLVPRPPDITSNFATISYDAGTGWLDVVGYPVSIDFDGVAPPDYDIIDFGPNTATHTIHVKVDGSGNVASDPGNSLVITGLIDRPSETFTTLLTGTVTGVGFAPTPGSKVFEFTFNVTGGELASQFGPTGGVIFGAVAYGDQPFTGDFDTSFKNNGSGNADTFPVPEPASLLLMLAGGAMVIGRKVARRCAP